MPSSLPRGPSAANQFPYKLHAMLVKAEQEGLEDAAGWMADGRSFIVRNRRKFIEHLLPMFFKQTKFKSFQRQLNLWGFETAHGGRHDEALGGTRIFHPSFVKGRVDLCSQMAREKMKCTAAASISSATKVERAAAALSSPRHVSTDDVRAAAESPSSASASSKENGGGENAAMPRTIPSTVTVIRNGTQPLTASIPVSAAAASSSRSAATPSSPLNSPACAVAARGQQAAAMQALLGGLAQQSQRHHATSQQQPRPQLQILELVTALQSAMSNGNVSTNQSLMTSPSMVATPRPNGLLSAASAFRPQATYPAAAPAAWAGVPVGAPLHHMSPLPNGQQGLSQQLLQLLQPQLQPQPVSTAGAFSSIMQNLRQAQLLLAAQAFVANQASAAPSTNVFPAQAQLPHAQLPPVAPMGMVKPSPALSASMPPSSASAAPPKLVVSSPAIDSMMREAAECLPDLRNHQAKVTNIIATVEHALARSQEGARRS
mmetsp:Transcript_20448/g.58130  ORF Transcript_20448/g.58130 Transcript_20448/m.58130 type:complete len:488 (-) Transcript_20448:256-1719(-)